MPNPAYREYVFNCFFDCYPVSEDIKKQLNGNNSRVQIAAGNWADGQIDPAKVIWKTWLGVRIPFLFDRDDTAELIEVRDDTANISYDIITSAFYFLSGWQEYHYMRRHSAVRYPYAESLQHRLDITHIPVVNYYFDILKTAIERVYKVTLKVRAWGKAPYAVCLTHDIDTARKGWIQDLAATLRQGQPNAALRVITDKLRNGDTCFNFDDIMSLEERYGARASFYFIGRQGKVYAREAPEKGFVSEAGEKITDAEYFFKHKKVGDYRQALENADYDIRYHSLQGVLADIRSRGFEAGIHGSFGSNLSSEQFRQDLESIGGQISGGRFHYLCFDATCTFDILEAAGQVYDSTLGFAEASGFRNGICHPFNPFNFKKNIAYHLLEIPLVVMDATFRSYQKCPPETVLPEIDKLRETVARFNGCLTVLWHNAYFTPYKFAGWRRIFEAILNAGKADGALLISGKQVSEMWANSKRPGK